MLHKEFLFLSSVKSIYLGVIGVGTVGRAFVDLLNRQQKYLMDKLQRKVELYAVAARSQKTLDQVTAKIKTLNPLELCQNDKVDIVIELAGGYEQPKEWIKEALIHRKMVITANKALLAKYGHELFPLAAQYKSAIFFEAAVGGGMPAIRSLQELMVGNKIHSFACIINGTCNYILTQMYSLKQNFKEVLKDAQDRGYAEADPSFDVEGIDTVHKVALLASLVTQKYVDFEKIPVQGITQITPFDLEMAAELGFSIKLLGRFTFEGSKAVYFCLPHISISQSSIK